MITPAPDDTALAGSEVQAGRFGQHPHPEAAPEFCVVLPTLNEKPNLVEVCTRLGQALTGLRWEVIIVDDDSPDGTAELARQLAADDPRIRCIRRVGRRGLSSACIEGILATSAPYVAVMDADLQHDETLLPVMLSLLRKGEADLVVASRYLVGASLGSWDLHRAWLSKLATLMSGRRVLDRLTDPMSGFFALPRVLFESQVYALSGLGFKLLLDFMSSAPQNLRVRELPYQFGSRVAGRSKMSSAIAAQFLLMLLDKRIGRFVPVRFIAFAGVGLLGLGVHFTVLAALLGPGQVGFTFAQAIATGVAMTCNFSLNNELTYAGAALRGRRWLQGLLSFMLVCGTGALANVGISSYLFSQQATWPLAAAAGVAVGAIWNFAVSARYTWRDSAC